MGVSVADQSHRRLHLGARLLLHHLHARHSACCAQGGGFYLATLWRTRDRGAGQLCHRRGDPTLPYFQPPHFDPPPIPSYSSRRVHSETPIYVPPHSCLWVMGHHSNISSSICTHLHADAHLWMHMHTHACRCMQMYVHYPTLD